MTKEIIHICCSNSAVGTMKYAIKKGFLQGKKVLGFTDDLSNGPLDGYNELRSRIDWCKNLYMEDADEVSEEIKDSYEKFNKDIMELKGEDIYLWYGNSATEICGLMHVLSMLEGKLQNIYTINVSEITYNTGKRNEYTPRVVGEIMPEESEEFLGIRKPLDPGAYTGLMEQWKKLKRENSNLRVYVENQVKSVNVDYFDDMILRYTFKKFMHSARTVGEVIGRAESYVSDAFIFWRVTELIREGKVAYRGNLEVMRELEIKKVT